VVAAANAVKHHPGASGAAAARVVTSGSRRKRSLFAAQKCSKSTRMAGSLCHSRRATAPAMPYSTPVDGRRRNDIELGHLNSSNCPVSGCFGWWCPSCCHQRSTQRF
jgi:hypothetical protein